MLKLMDIKKEESSLIIKYIIYYKSKKYIYMKIAKIACKNNIIIKLFFIIIIKK